MKHISALVALLMLAASAMADDDGVPRRTTASDNTGLSVFVNIGAHWKVVKGFVTKKDVEIVMVHFPIL